MHIVQIVSTYPPYKGGMGNVAARYTSELQKKGHEISVLTPRYRFHDPYPKDGAVHRVKPMFSFGNSAFVPKMYSLLDHGDILHLHYPFYGGAELVGWYKFRHPEKPLVISYHMDNVGSGFIGLFFRLYRRLIMPWILKQADTIIVSSLDYVENSDLQPYLSKIQVEEIPFAISYDFTPIKAKSPHKAFRILFVAGLDKAHYFKGLHNLIDAVSLLVHEHQQGFTPTELELVIVGDGDKKSEYQKRIQEKNIESYVTFAGRVSDHRLIAEYREANVTILPSIDKSEAFGLVLIESMACGTPVIASNLPGVRSVVDHLETGLLVYPNDIADLAMAIDTLATNVDLYDKMQKNTQKIVEKRYRWPKVIEKLEQMYKNV